MILVSLSGGLGNQLFQYAYGRRLSLKYGVPLRLDTSWFACQSMRSFRLGVYGLDKLVASPAELAPFFRRSHSHGLLTKVYRGLESLHPQFRYRTIHEKSTGSYINQDDQPGHLYLVGNWQSEDYFKDIRSQLLADLIPVSPPDTQNAAILDQITHCHSVSLHVRRGDYVINPLTNKFHGVLGESYYSQAINMILAAQDAAHFFVFSDDLKWCRKYLNIPGPYTFVDINGPEKEYEDLRLMSTCKHQIIANSSFSWWGAWLDDYPEKIVIAPEKWFKSPDISKENILPKGWIQI